jgi:hypothetical protein
MLYRSYPRCTLTRPADTAGKINPMEMPIRMLRGISKYHSNCPKKLRSLTAGETVATRNAASE